MVPKRCEARWGRRLGDEYGVSSDSGYASRRQGDAGAEDEVEVRTARLRSCMVGVSKARRHSVWSKKVHMVGGVRVAGVRSGFHRPK